MQLILKKFDPRKIDDTRICLLIGKRGTGKTILGKDILYYHRHIPAGIVQSATEEGNGFYGKFVPQLFVYSEFNLDAIERLLSRQKALCHAGKAQPVFLVLDDCCSGKKLFTHKTIRELFYLGRHFLVFVLISSQYVLDLPPDMRSNVDFIFILRENIRANRERIFKSFAGIFGTFDVFNQVMNAVTENHGVLVIDNTSTSNDIDKCCYWYRANPNRQFKMGSPAMWAYSARMQKRGGEDDNAPAAAAASSSSDKKGTGLTIIKKK